MTQVLHLSSRWNKFLVSLFISIQFFFPWVAGCHLIIWDVFHKTISSLFFSLLVFQQLRSSFCCKRAPSSYVSLRSSHSILTFVTEALWCCSLRPIVLFCLVHVEFFPFTVGVLPKLHHSYSFYILFNRSIVSIIPLLTGVSSKCFHFAKFIFHAFHFQPECCRNWSLSFLVHLVSTGVLACTSCPLQLFSHVFQPTRS